MGDAYPEEEQRDDQREWEDQGSSGKEAALDGGDIHWDASSHVVRCGVL